MRLWPLSIGLLAAGFLPGLASAAPTYDLLLRGGRVLDGAGNPWFVADVAVQNGRIAAVGSLGRATARTVLDAEGLVIAPGFIDVHTHVDAKIDDEPAVKNYLLQGVTTVVGGNCGESRLPLDDLFDKLGKKGIALNFASFVGHSTVRHEVMGDGDRPPSAGELARMQKLVEREMRAGAVGLSTGLSYVPGRFAATDELVALAKIAQPFRGVYATHLRNQGERIREAIEEAIHIGRNAGLTVQISHVKLAKETVWGKRELITEPIERAREAGLEIYMDEYPYTATNSDFSSSFPGWAVAGGNAAFVERLADPETYRKIRDAFITSRLTSTRGADPLAAILVSRNAKHPEYEGKSLTQILEMLGRPRTAENAADLVIEMQKSDEPYGVFFQMDEGDVEALLQKTYNMIASDGDVEVPGVGNPHPRAYGTFPRVLARYVRERGVLTLADAVRKMTSLPAQALGFWDRGLVRPGMAADLVVFHPGEVEDTATYDKPHQYPRGIRFVIVNGRMAARDGRLVEADAGRILYGAGRPSRAARPASSRR